MTRKPSDMTLLLDDAYFIVTNFTKTYSTVIASRFYSCASLWQQLLSLAGSFSYKVPGISITQSGRRAQNDTSETFCETNGGNGNCDGDLNNEECKWDGGDCCECKYQHLPCPGCIIPESHVDRHLPIFAEAIKIRLL